LTDDSIYGTIIVGSGLAGAQACQTMVEAGADVLLLDAGLRDRPDRQRFPDMDFESVRNSITEQRSLFLGHDMEGIPWGRLKAGAQLTPSRSFVSQGTDHWLSLISESFVPMESLAYGGLGNAWGAGCYIYSEQEFAEMGFNRKDFQASYQKVADRIGISAAMDDAAAFTVSGLRGLQAPIHIEPRMQRLLSRYELNKHKWNKDGFYMGRPALAILTKEWEGRRPYSYEDMDFWHDNSRAVYRPWMTMDSLQERPGFRKIFGKVVISFEESNGIVEVHTSDIHDGSSHTYCANRLLLCPGVLGSARIVLRSLPQIEHLPILSNSYAYVPMLDWRSVGQTMPARRSGMGQLSVFYDADGQHGNVSMASLYTYRSLMLFRLVKEVPLNFSDARAIMQYLMSGITIAGIHHPEKTRNDRKLSLEPDGASPTGDHLKVSYPVSNEDRDKIASNESRFLSKFRSLGQWPLKTVRPPQGASIHYAGALPVSDNEQIGHSAIDGRVYGTRNVFVGDASCFRFLPAKGISFTLMANAHRVASGLLDSFKEP
jgi:hypothetical protein